MMTLNFWLVTTASVSISTTVKPTCLRLGQSGVTNLNISFLYFSFLDVLSSKIIFMKTKFCEILEIFEGCIQNFPFKGD